MDAKLGIQASVLIVIPINQVIKVSTVINLSQEELLQLASTITVFCAAVIPIYLSLKLTNKLRLLTILLSVFIIIHGIYHLAYYVGLELLAEGFFRTISIAILIIFGIVFFQSIKHRKDEIKARA